MTDEMSAAMRSPGAGHGRLERSTAAATPATAAVLMTSAPSAASSQAVAKPIPDVGR